VVVIKKCITALKTRMMVNLDKFILKVVTQDGVQELDLGDVSVV
jgi:hypothetical protein